MSITPQTRNTADVSFGPGGDLPEGWAETSVGSLIEIMYGKGLKQENRLEGTVSVYGSNGVVGTHKTSLTAGPTIVIGRKGSVGAVHFSPSPCWPIDTTYFIDQFNGLDPVFLTYAVRNLNLAELDTSTAIPGLNRDDIYAQPVLLPPLSEQRRIVAKVEELLTRVNAARERLSRVPAILKRFRHAVLAAACPGLLTEGWREQNETNEGSTSSEDSPDDLPSLPRTWGWQRLESVCKKVVDCPHSTPKWTDSGRLCVRTTNFKPGFLDLSGVRYVSNQTFSARVKRLRPQLGDILYSREGGILGIACMIPPGVELCLGQRMMLLRPKAHLSGELLMHWLNSPPILRRVQELTGGSASPHLNVRDIKNFPIPVAPPTEQQEIVRRVEALFKLADAIEKRVAAATARANKLIQAILAKAFRGELVPTEAELARRENRPYEAASALLERIKAERAAANARADHVRITRRARHKGATQEGRP